MKKALKLAIKSVPKRPKLFPEILITVATVITDDQDILAAYLKEVAQVLQKHFIYYEILIIDNGSQDGSHLTIQHLQKNLPNIRLLLLSRRNDQEIAFAAALENSIGDYVVLLDIAYDPPALIPKLIKTAQNGNDIVIAERIDRRENTLLEMIGAKLFYWLISKMLGFSFAPNASNYRVFSRRAVQAITKIRSRNRYLRYYNATIGFNQAYVPYSRIYRRKINRQKNFLSSIHFTFSVIVSHSTLPLRMATYAGMLGAAMSFIVLLGVIISGLIKKHFIQSLNSPVTYEACMFLFLFLIFTIATEYIGRILNESKEQSLYFVVDEQNSAVITSESDRINVV